MKISTLKLFLFGVLMAFSVGGAMACDLSNIALCGYGPSVLLPLLNPAFPGDKMICVTVCNGYGRTGAAKGAGSDTRSISFGWYTALPGFTIRAFNPGTITSGRGFANCTMAGTNIGAQGGIYNDQGTVIFVDPGYYGISPCASQPFGCVQSQAACGPVSQQCITYTFQVNFIPDSLRVFGIEGAGNPLAGCYPDADMMIDFGVTPVEWGTITTEVIGASVKVKWITRMEVNSDFFMVERVNENGNFVEIGNVAAAGNSNAALRYEFTDLAPMPGLNTYRIVEVDKDGGSMHSTAVDANYTVAPGMNWGAVGPNPATNHLNMTFYNEKSETVLLSVYDLQGNAVVKQELQSIIGANAVRLALDKVDAGAYFVSLQGASTKLTRKIVKL